MNKTSFFFLVEIVITLLFSNCYSQNEGKYFELQRAIGDLNNDKTKDIVIVYHDTINPKAPYRLEVYFAKIDSAGDVKVISTEKAIKPDFPDAETIDDRFYSGDMFNQIEIKNNILLVRGHLTRGHYVHKYRLQNGAFELIGFAKTESDGQSVIEIIEFNLSTRKRIIKTEGFSSKQKPKTKTELIKLTTLPKLGEFTPLENKLY
nr:hypothetical protein [uncultured Flavobacterium sp.]